MGHLVRSRPASHRLASGPHASTDRGGRTISRRQRGPRDRRVQALRLPDRGARRRRQIAGGAAQLTAKVVVVAPPDGTVTVCGFAAPPTVQFAATPESATVCWVGSSAVNATLPLV